MHLVMILLSVISYYFPDCLIILIITTCSYTILFLQEYDSYISTYNAEIPQITMVDKELTKKTEIKENNEDSVLNDFKQIILNHNKQIPVRRLVKMKPRICGYDNNDGLLSYTHL